MKWSRWVLARHNVSDTMLRRLWNVSFCGPKTRKEGPRSFGIGFGQRVALSYELETTSKSHASKLKRTRTARHNNISTPIKRTEES